MHPNTATGYEATGANPNWKPSTASDFLETASRTLGERGKQYDPAGKQERSMTAIIAAFNAIYPHNPLTVHMGWQFMSLVKMVRGATKPHADSALDQVAYAALAAEEVAGQLNQPEQLHEAYAHNPYAGKPAVERKQEAEVDATMKRIRAGYKGCPQCGADVDKEAGSCQCGWEFEEQEQQLCEDEGCQHHGTPHVCVTSVETEAQYKERVAAERLEQLLAHNRSLEVQLDATHSALSDYVCRFDLNKEYMTKEQVLAGQAKHEAQVASLRNSLQISEQAAETQRGKCIAQSSRISELQTLVDNLRSSLAQATKEAPCAHNTDEPKAPRPEYVDPFDQYGDIRSPMHHTLGGHDPARGGLAYPQGKDAPTPQ